MFIASNGELYDDEEIMEQSHIYHRRSKREIIDNEFYDNMCPSDEIAMYWDKILNK